MHPRQQLRLGGAWRADGAGDPGALAGKPVGGGPQSGPDLKLLALSGHDTNLVLMAGVFGLNWTLPGEPDGTAPSTALAFELWSRRRAPVRPRR